MSDPLARAREIHEAADLPPWQEQRFVHNTYAALLDVIEKAFMKSELFGDWGFRTRGGVFMEAPPRVQRALAALEARIKEATDE